MKQLWKYTLLLTLLMSFSDHLLVAASCCHALPPQPQSEQGTISMPLEVVVVIEKTEISSPYIPTSVIGRSRRTISQLTNPAPVTYAQYVFYNLAKYAQENWHYGRRIIINLPSEQIPYPFHSFW
ncbi:MAG: hypothetical protein MJZ64_08455 [Paludibacteraceae bacterium]|nr:hypothetical protein [Paludibacteraceae bacterium]